MSRYRPNTPSPQSVGDSQRRLMLLAQKNDGVTVTEPRHYVAALKLHDRGFFARPGPGHHFFTLTEAGRYLVSRFRVVHDDRETRGFE